MRKRRTSTVALVGVIISMALTLCGVSTASADPSASGATATTERQQIAAPDSYTPLPGVMFNNPLGDRSHVIARHIKRSINSAPPGTRIRLVTWNFKSTPFFEALRDAHQRGVSVRVLMAYGLYARYGDDTPAHRLKRVLARGNAGRTASMTSWLRTCRSSCRGKAGILHSKFYLFERAGEAEKVVMSTSANLTEVAANRQWNDMFTVTGRTVSYDEYLKVFNQMARDVPVSSPYSTFPDKELTGWFHPAGRHNIPMSMLDKVTCTGATNGVNGKTVIRIAQAIFNGTKGAMIAKKVKSLSRQGCNVKIVYTAMGHDAYEALAGVRKRRILQDLDGDGFHDRYLHIKSLAIHGHYGDERGARIVMQGSANWSGMGWLADEQGFIIRRGSAERAYAGWVDHLYADPPRNPYPRTTARMAAQVDNPYKYVDFD